MPNTEAVVLTNMCMITDGSKVLVQDRKDPDWPGLVFPGGKVEPNEPFVTSVIREVYEETGLRIADVQLCGVKQFTHSQGHYRYAVFLYMTSTFSRGAYLYLRIRDFLSPGCCNHCPLL